MSHPNSTNHPSPGQLIFIFDQLRTRSHLFHRFLSTHPALTPLWHPYIKAAFLGPEAHAFHTRNSPARRHETEVDMIPFYGTDTYESCGGDLEREVEKARAEGKALLANEHGLNILKQDLMFQISRGEKYDVPANPTAIPDRLYESLTPIILIRHPCHQLRSSYARAVQATQMRPGDEDFSNTTTAAFIRFLYDDFASKGRTPIVVDGDDVLSRTREVAETVCARLGLDAGLVQDTWEPIEDYGTTEPIMRAYMAEVLSSTGVRGEESGVSDTRVKFARCHRC